MSHKADALNAEHPLTSKSQPLKGVRSDEKAEAEYQGHPPILRPSQSFLASADPNAPIVVGEHGGKQSQTEFDFTQVDPFVVGEIARVMYEGAKKYGKDNWRRIPEMEHLNHVFLHLYAILAGDEQDDHWGHALTRMAFAYAKHERPDYLGEAAYEEEEFEPTVMDNLPSASAFYEGEFDPNELNIPLCMTASVAPMLEAKRISQFARCNRANVGCVIVDKFDDTAVAAGVNGPPGNSCPDTLSHLDLDHCPDAVHAEIDAVRRFTARKAPRSLYGYRAYVYGHYGPCPNCRKALKNAGIQEIIYTPGEFYGKTFGYGGDHTLNDEAFHLPESALTGGTHYQWAR